MSCTCNGSVGQPAGRLMWFKDNAPVKLGTYNDVSLMLTLAVNRSDDGDVLRCDVDWVTRTEGSPYTLRVACESCVLQIHFWPRLVYLKTIAMSELMPHELFKRFHFAARQESW